MNDTIENKNKKGRCIIIKKYDYLIVGCGLFGATFAEKMHSFGKRCLIIDKRDHIAGNAYTERKNGILVHVYGAHIFHTNDEEVWNYVNRFSRFSRFINSPLAYYKGEIYNLPFNMNTFSKMWKITTPKEAKEIIEKQRKEYGVPNPVNLEEQAINLVGKDIYEKLIRGYTMKQWGVDPKKLPPSIIKRLPVRYTYDNNYFNDYYQGIPEKGYTALVENMIKGIDLTLNADYFDNKSVYDELAEKIVYTGPIDRFFDYRFGRLGYRSLRFEHELLPIANFQGNAVVNYTDFAIPYTRIIEHKFFEKNDQEETIVTREYPADFTKTKEPYYPINDEHNTRIYEQYRDQSKDYPNIIFGGRLAEYRYYDMHHVIKSALNMANMLMHK